MSGTPLWEILLGAVVVLAIAYYLYGRFWGGKTGGIWSLGSKKGGKIK